MANPYTSQSASNYNANPPSDDGSHTASNAVAWATIKTKLADSLLGFANAINAAVLAAFNVIFFNSVSPQSTNYTIASTDRGKLINASNGATITLLTAASAQAGFAVTVKNTGTTAASVAPNGTDQIDLKNASITLNPSDALTFVSDGSAWWTGTGLNFVRWGVAGGTADALTLTSKPPIQGLADGQLIAFRAAAANATTTPTLSPDGLGPYTITKRGGQALAPSDLAGNLAECICRYRASNTQLELLNPATATTITIFNASGTYTPTVGAKAVYVVVVGGGGGGGGGSQYASGTGNSGGAGGGGGAAAYGEFRVSDLGGSVTVTIGAAGTAGAGANAATTNGTNGGTGGQSKFGAFLTAFGGGGGQGGLNGSSNGGFGATVTSVDTLIGTTTTPGFNPWGGAPGAGDPQGVVGSRGGNTIRDAAGGGSGAGVATTPATLNGGAGGLNQYLQTAATGGAGASSGTAGAGQGLSAGPTGSVGGGGGGGGNNTGASSAIGGAGGAGQTPGGGGGGGGAVLNGASNVGGAGGVGAPGQAIVIEYF